MKLPKFILRILKNFKFLPKKTILEYRYQYYTGKKLNLDNPIEINEKIQWLKLYYHVPILSVLADKYAVTEYVKDKIGIQYLNKIYGVYKDVETINFDLFPNKFVLKATHGSSTNLIVTDKSTLDIPKTKKILQKWLKHNQYKKVGFEWAYKNIQPRIICEKFFESDNHHSIIDYKFYCFNGIPKFIFVQSKDKKGGGFMNFYDLQWNEMPVYKKIKGFVRTPFKKPNSLKKKIELASKLADRLPFVRVDFYEINNQPVFGEMTFYPSDGKRDFYPDKYNTIFGDYLKLPKIPKGKNTITEY